MPTAANIIEYASGESRTAPRGYLRVAISCWIVPAIAGLIALAGYWATSNDRFIELGMLDLFVGAGTLVIGELLVLIYLCFAWNVTVDRGRAIRQGLLVGALLFSNLPLAFLCFICGIQLVGPTLHH